MKTHCSRTRSATLLAALLVFTAAYTVCAYAADPNMGSGRQSTAREAEVLETMQADSYTYVRVRAADGEIWAAAPLTTVKVGDLVNLPAGALMQGFKSKTLDRTFETIYFLDAIEVLGGPEGAAGSGSAHAGHSGVIPAAPVDVGPVEKAEGGSTVAELFAARNEIAGKEVIVRGQVVKFNEEIMGRNWIHIRDGSGEAGTNDLTVTTKAGAKLGDIILVRGTAATDRNFGAGYSYNLIVEEATIEVE